MNRRLKLKINGDSPRSLLLAFVLAKFKCDLYIFDSLINSESNYADQIYLFSNFTKNLLNNFDIWNEFEDISYGFNSFEFKDNIVSEQLLLRTEILEKYLNTIGWTVKYSDIKKLLTNKLKNFDNVHFILKNQLVVESPSFDFEFNFKSYDEYPLEPFKRINEQILIFNVCLRGNVEKRLYEINTTDGLLTLTPINNNFYQIIWNNVSIQIKERALKSRSFFLDNLTTLLPNELKIDQIIGDINFLNISDISSNYIIKNKSIYFNENKFKSNILFNLKFDIFIDNILKIYNFLEKNDMRNIRILSNLGFFYLYRKYIELKIQFSFSNLFFNLFTLNNIFSLFLRKLLFILLKRVYLLKLSFIRNLLTFNIKDFIK
tara:strand:+ start:85 stop:1209 length:1125 start_codon:yes stop_codon:yes gene_type:complete